MAIHLSATDVAALAHANTVLLSPFAFTDAMAWRNAAGRAVESCVGADAYSYVLPLDEEEQIAASPDTKRVLAAIFPPPAWMFEALTVRRRALSLTVADWEELFDIRVVRGAAFYNDVVRPQHLLAPISMMADVAHGALPGTVSVYFESERSARSRAPRRKQMMELLFPAFHAGMGIFMSFRRSLASFAALTEDAGIGVVTFGPREAAGVENDHCRRLMSAEPERDRVRAEVRRAARGARSLGALGGRLSRPRRATAEVRTGSAAYRIAATLLGDDSPRAPAVIVALVERLVDRSLSAWDMRTRYALTGREVETALLLQRGLPTREIALALGIAVNTARRHVDKILLKLDVSTRTAAAAKIFGR
jgi:DNA-binding CsgD family transcriptional regulator